MIITLFMIFLLSHFKNISCYYLNKNSLNKKTALSLSSLIKNKYYIVGNWKMNTNSSTSAKLAKEITKNKKLNQNDNIELVLLPPLPFICDISEIVKESNIYLGGQSVYYKTDGPYTGGVSASMLHSIGCKYVLVGHSERRTLFKESNKDINLMLRVSLEDSLKPILCIGENLDEYKKGLNTYVCKNQLDKGLSGFNEYDIQNIIIAYEPVWAIGTGLFPSKKEIQKIHENIRQWFVVNYGTKVANKIPIIYGGSVSDNNIEDILDCYNVNGVLVGSASLDSNKFNGIYNTCSKYIVQ